MTRVCLIALLLTVCLSVIGLSAQTIAEPDVRVWTVNLDTIPREYGITRSGLLFIWTEKGLAAWQVESGREAWRVDLPATRMTKIGENRVALYNGKGLVAFDLDTGKQLWTLDALPMTRLKDCFRATDTVVLAMGPADETVFRVAGVDNATGRLLWQSDSIAEGEKPKAKDVFAFTHVTPVPDNTLVLQLNRGGIVRLDTTTGKVLWRVDSTTKPGFTVGWPAGTGLEAEWMMMTPPPLVSGDFVVTTSGAINAKTGAVAWRVPAKPAGWTSGLAQAPSGVLVVRATDVRSKRTLQLVDPATGTGMWPNPVSLSGNLPFLVRDDTVFVGVDKGLATVSLSTGTLVGQMPLPDFMNWEEPTSIRTVGDGDLLLESHSNLMRVTPAGSVVFHRHYGVPRVGLRPLNGVVMPTSRNPVKLSYYWTNDSDSLGQKGILLVNPETGEEIGTVRRKDRASSYAIDPMTKMAVGIDNKTMTGYRFAPLPEHSGPPHTAKE